MKFSISNEISICDAKAFAVQHAKHHRYELIGNLVLQAPEDQGIRPDGIKGLLSVRQALTIVNPPGNIRRYLRYCMYCPISRSKSELPIR